MSTAAARQHSPRQREMKQGLRALLFSLLLLLAAMPFLLGSLPGRAVFVLLSSVIMLAGAYASSLTRRDLALALLLAMPATITRWSDLFVPTRAMELAATTITTVFYAYIALLVFVRVLRARTVGADEIFGGLSVYVLLGYLWSDAYWALEILVPGSFVVTGGARVALSDLFYYSFTTLMTLGTSDVLARTPAARSLSIFEALGGTFFIAVFIARLVSASREGRA